jgi:hypothetical protein
MDGMVMSSTDSLQDFWRFIMPLDAYRFPWMASLPLPLNVPDGYREILKNVKYRLVPFVW